MVGAFWWVLVFRCLFCVCFLLDSLRLTLSLVVPFLGDCDNPVARTCRGKKFLLIYFSSISPTKHSTLHHHHFSQLSSLFTSSTICLYQCSNFNHILPFCLNRFKTFPFYSKNFLRKSTGYFLGLQSNFLPRK